MPAEHVDVSTEHEKVSTQHVHVPAEDDWMTAEHVERLAEDVRMPGCPGAGVGSYHSPQVLAAFRPIPTGFGMVEFIALR